MDVIERAVEPLELNDHQWIFKDEIDRISDEWYERDRRFSIVFISCNARHVIALRVDAEKLWELLIQRGFAECDELHEPSLVLVEGIRGGSAALRLLPTLMLRDRDENDSERYREIIGSMSFDG